MPISCLRLHEYRNKERTFTSAGYVVIAYNKKFTYEKRKKKPSRASNQEFQSKSAVLGLSRKTSYRIQDEFPWS